MKPSMFFAHQIIFLFSMLADRNALTSTQSDTKREMAQRQQITTATKNAAV